MRHSSLQIVNGAARYLFSKHCIELSDYEDYLLEYYLDFKTITYVVPDV